MVLYPNPFGDIDFITGSNGLVYLYDINGRLALSQQIAEDGSVSIGSLATGIYVIKINGMEYKRIKE